MFKILNKICFFNKNKQINSKIFQIKSLNNKLAYKINNFNCITLVKNFKKIEIQMFSIKNKEKN